MSIDCIAGLWPADARTAQITHSPWHLRSEAAFAFLGLVCQEVGSGKWGVGVNQGLWIISSRTDALGGTFPTDHLRDQGGRKRK
jgi:hypothetical protein